MAAPSAVLFWNGVALDLNVDDHTLDILLRGAPGPTASAYMLAVAHIATAEACAGFGGAGFTALRQSATFPAGSDRRAAIGGAAFGALTHIYCTGPRAKSLAKAATKFLNAIGSNAGAPVWSKGIELGRKIAQGLWDREEVADALGRDGFVPKKGGHNVDPEDMCQGFCCVCWGEDIAGIRSGIKVAEIGHKRAYA